MSRSGQGSAIVRTRVVITGVAEFIGASRAERALHDGYEVMGIDNLARGLREEVPSGVKVLEMNFRE